MQSRNICYEPDSWKSLNQDWIVEYRFLADFDCEKHGLASLVVIDNQTRTSDISVLINRQLKTTTPKQTGSENPDDKTKPTKKAIPTQLFHISTTKDFYANNTNVETDANSKRIHDKNC